MNAKDYLKDIARMESHIGAKKQRVAVLKEIATSPSTPDMSGMPRSPNTGKSAIADTVIKYITLEEEIKADELSLEEKKVFILSLIGELDSTEQQTVLIKRYFEKKSWIDIATELFYSTRWIYKLHGYALEVLNEKL